MKNDFKKENLKEIIEYLETKPKVEGEFYPVYDRRIDDLLYSMDPDYDYMNHHEEVKDKKIEDYSLDDLKTMYTFLCRGERFCTGMIQSYIEDGTLLKLAKRHLELIEK